MDDMIENGRVRNIYYRGRLNSCNYTCSYCVFGDKSSVAAIEEDRIAWQRFIARIREQREMTVRIFLLPYGEAMIHDYYVEGILELAQLSHVEGICCQTNLSFSVSKFLRLLRIRKLPFSKFKFWASFHPEMVASARFTRKIHCLMEKGVDVCAGVVGNPENIALIRKLRKKLDCRVYLFINAMQGLKRPLSEKEKDDFEAIDNLFMYDYSNFKAAPKICQGGTDSLFVDAKGKVCACPRSEIRIGDFYGDALSVIGRKEDICRRKVCDCYIAYSNLRDTPLAKLLGNGVFWRIPEKKTISAAFFDIDGTLTRSDGTIPESYIVALKYFSYKIPLYLATSLPIDYAKRRLGHYFSLFSGGMFAAGSHISIGDYNEYSPISDSQSVEKKLSCISNEKNYKIRRYVSQERIFKYAIMAPSVAEATELKFLLTTKKHEVYQGRCLVTLVDGGITKGTALMRICELTGLDPKSVLAVGNSMQDSSMMPIVGHFCAVLGADEDLKQLSEVVLNPDSLPAFFCPSGI